ncbi:metallophosphoesterase family protein [Cognatishimia maritima]|uniref:Calcineurin-like phosphoesterase superfamily domain-containing protein n=1 Tax=Cognatishimia maritima TaxID=870908 RepID=A0A1M5I369_9RHOB|nr:metallophosphoesterase family protein [Cognatishimia maritima]SHG22711.1 Calcineurin-like phosphoesterase superfamily domain-containing protein [Cognatishimia maritima]
MKVCDLGQLDTPLLLFGGPYSNLHASRALLDFAKKGGFGPEHVICTGDLVAYCADPVETATLWQDFGGPILAGNCEKQLAENAMDCGCGFEAGTTCDLLSAGWFAHADRLVRTKMRAWLGALPDLMVFQHHGQRFAVVHGGLTDISRFLWPVSPEAAFLQEFDAIADQIGRVDGVIAGHCGIAFEKMLSNGQRWINTGAIGMPPNDGTPQTAFAVMTAGQVAFHRLDYDAASASKAMEAVGLTQGYHRALLNGHWPSEDVLPPDMRR